MAPRPERPGAARDVARQALMVGAAALLVLLPGRLPAQTVVTNSAAVTYQTIAGTDSVLSNPVQSTLVYPQLFLEKLVTGATVARIGEQLTYSIGYRNTSGTVVARNAVLVDSLPVGLGFVSSQPPAQVSGRVLTWTLGDVAAGASGQIAVVAQVEPGIRDTLTVRNLAILAALNAGALAATAAPVDLVGVTSTQLAVELSADVLEVGLGETVPYTVAVENTGAVPVADVRIHVALPDGARFAKGSLLGADSIHADGPSLTIYAAGPLAPGARLTVRYAVAVVSADGDLIATRAYGTAENEFVRSEEATAWVRVRRSWPMETRAAIGKVWVDLDGDGVQDGDEPGVDGADIWTDDGEVATTDQDGKFSFRNLRPGRHAFRLDVTTLPAAYRLPSDAASDFVVLDADGWTSPRIAFRVLPVAGTTSQVLLPVAWRFTARPIRSELPQAGPRLVEGPATLARFAPNSTTPFLAFENRQLQVRLAQLGAQRADCRVEVAGHTDLRPIRTGPFADNQRLSEARADSLAARLRALGLAPDQLFTVGRGAREPLASGTDPFSLQLNRRSDVQLVCGGAAAEPELRQVEYQIVIENDYDVELKGLAVHFDPPADSARIELGDSLLARVQDHRSALPAIPPRSQVVVRGWLRSSADSVLAVLEGGNRQAGRLLAQVHNPLMPAEGISRATVATAALPDPRAVPAGATVEVTIEPASLGWPDLTYALPPAWQVVPGSVRRNGAPAADPKVDRDRNGQPVLRWHFDQQTPSAVSLEVRPAEAPVAAEPVTLPPLRTPEERAAEGSRAFLAGPGVEIFQPADGTVLPSDRLYVGVRGEPNAPVALFDGDSLLAEAMVRIDGVHDFIAIPLSRGPHRLRVRMRNSWQNERWDSATVHVTGAPAEFLVPKGRVAVVADGHGITSVRARVVDRWGVPVISSALVTVATEGAEPANADADPSSVGVQVQADQAGWLAILLKPGRKVGTGRLTLEAGESRREVQLELQPALRPLMVNGVGRLGFGASPEAFGAVTARGRLDRRTAIVASYDSRYLDAGRDFLGRDFDPLEESRYPVLGDAGQVRTVNASRQVFGARVERGLDWLAVGDISTDHFAGGMGLAGYHRTLSGVAGRFTTGPVTWGAFGSLTSQSVLQTQLRGRGVSGPYPLAQDIVPGSERITIETRARDNAQRLVTSQALNRFVDYQIDYQRGTLLFKRPVPAADAYENPVFIVVTYEARSGGDQRWVSGLKAALDAREWLGKVAMDSVRLAIAGVRSEEPTGAQYLAGAGLKLVRFGGLDVGADIAYSQTPDSSGYATEVDGALQLLGGAVNLGAGWMRVGQGFGNPAKAGLRGGTEELRLSGGLRLGPTELKAAHQRQTFAAQGIEREQTTAGVVQHLGRAAQLEVRHASDQFSDGSGLNDARGGEMKLTWTPTASLKLWTEGRRQFAYSGTALHPDHLGGGVSFRLNRFVSLEAQHRQVLPPAASPYAVTNLGVRTNVGAGTQAWSSYQLAGGADGRYNAAVVGLNNRLRLGSWTLNTLFERRVGLDRAPGADPVRALPFLQAEEDYWAAGMGIELLPADAPYRLSARGEFREGSFLSTRLATVAGDLSINRSLALLARQEYQHTEQFGGATPDVRRLRLSALGGLAFRPVRSEQLNVLAKLSWTQETNPAAGVLTQQGDEQRLIGAAEAIWAPAAWSELALRYAVRRTQAVRSPDSSLTQRLESWADYVGGRARIDLARWLAVGGEGRLLIERLSDTRRWDAAPSLILMPTAGFDLAAGYRVGDLRDPDFSVRGGAGWFVTVSVRLTERIVPTAAEFWRARF